LPEILPLVKKGSIGWKARTPTVGSTIREMRKSTRNRLPRL